MTEIATNMNLRKTFVRAIAAFVLALGISSAAAEHRSVHDEMLASVVFVECDVEFQGDLLLGGSGSGFLVANSEYVITNDHVIDRCHPDNRIKVFKEFLRQMYLAEIMKGKLPASMREELSQHPDFIARLQNDPALAEKYVLGWVEKVSNSQAKAGSANITQKLYIQFMGKEARAPIKVEVSNIVWASWSSDDKAHQTGVDVAILKLARPLTGKPSVAFATGSSAQINDEVYTVGFPGASGDAVTSTKYIPTIKKGIVSKLGGEDPRVTDAAIAKGWKGAPVIETDAAISAGNSGGPLYNEYGEVLGINTFGPKNNTAGIGWAQDISVVIPVMKDLGLSLPRITERPRGWTDKNAALIWAGAGGLGLLLLLTAIAAVRHRRASTRQPAAAAGQSPRRAQGPLAPTSVAPRPALKGRRGEYAGTSIPVPPNGLVLGRDRANTASVVFSENSDVSRKHCSVVYDDAARRFAVTDLESANGTFAIPGEKRLSPKQALVCKPGQVIRLGRQNEFELVLE